MFNKIVYILISLGGDSASIRYVVTLHIHKHTTSGIYLKIFVLFVFYSFGMKEDNYFEYTWGKSIVLAMSALTQRGTESGTPDSIGARISFFV